MFCICICIQIQQFYLMVIFYQKYEAKNVLLQIMYAVSGVTGGGGVRAECLPKTSDREISADLPGKKEGRKKGKRGENWEKKKENCEREGWKMEGGKVTKWGETFLFVFCFSLFKTTKICFGCTKMEIFYREKSISHPGKKSGKMTLPPQKNFPVMPLTWKILLNVLTF